MNTRLLALPFLGLLASTSACIITTDDPDSSLLVINRSSFDIDELNVTDVGSSTWGPDLLAGEGLLRGESIEVLLDCGTYDTRFIDETGFECQLLGLYLCYDDADWVITNGTCVDATLNAERTQVPTRTVELPVRDEDATL